ncbi:MAG: hypothetical protein ACI8QZ_000012 [Chlamydiales bacterium]|jgi:hypothetical protein
MKSPKKAAITTPLSDAWVALTHRVAAIVGASTALISLLWDVPVSQASARGALAWLAVGLISRATAWLLAQTSQQASS